MSIHSKSDHRFEQNSHLEDGYWASLMSEGEYAKTAIREEDEPFLYANLKSNDSPSTYHNTYHHQLHSDWAEIARIMNDDETMSLKVVGYNRGGLLVEWNTLRGFVPASQLVNFPQVTDESERRQALVDCVGNALDLRVIELDPDKNRLILSERAAQVEAGTRDHLLDQLQSGNIITGKVTNLCSFGAFVDLGGVEGLIHISELSWGRVTHPHDILYRDQIIKVYVLEVFPDEARVALSLKRLYNDPWVDVEKRYEVGQLIDCVITNVVDFGAFAQVEDGLEGLIHFSELAEGHFLHPRNVVIEGEHVQARVLTIDGSARRFGLSLRLNPAEPAQ